MIPPRNKPTVLAASLLVTCALQGCFTGVESTKRITDSDVRRQHAAGITAEERFMADIAPVPPSKWKPGRRLRVDSDRIGLIFTSASDPADSLAGKDLFFRAFTPVRSLTGDDSAEMTLADANGHTYYYRLPHDMAALDTMAALQVPFTVDIAMVQEVDRQMKGQSYFIKSPLWLDPATGERTDAGLRHIKVKIDSVGIGTSNYPAAVYFTPSEGPAGTYMLYMTIGSGRTATRNFNTLFAFNDPRRQYPEIRDDVWDLIKKSRVRDGMTRDECRLALGAPAQIEKYPTHGGMVERWRYSEGIYLIFEDGFLSRFRI